MPPTAAESSIRDDKTTQMNFIKVIEKVTSELDASGIRYALIGGFAMALRGVQRATVDLDFILMLEDLGKTDIIFKDAGYIRAFHSQNASTYMSKDGVLGRIDLLHAFRGPSLSMLERAERISVDDSLTLPVVQVEDIIGLKVQALSNAPERATRDWADIQMILEASAELGKIIDWTLLEDYLRLLDRTQDLDRLKTWYGTS